MTPPNTAVIGESVDSAESDAVQAQADSDADAVLAGMMGDDGSSADGDAPSAGDRARDDSGRFSKTSPEKTDADVASDTDEPDAAVPDSVNPDEYRRAVAALQRDKTPQSILDSMDPEAVVAWGLGRAKNQAEVDGFGKQLSELRAQLAQPRAGEGEPAETPGIDISSILKPLADELGEEYAKPIETAITQAVETALAGQGQQAKALEQMQAAFTDQQRRAARTELMDEFGLDSDDKWERVMSAVEVDKNVYATESDKVRAACRHCFADEMLAEFRTKLNQTHEKRDNGQPRRRSRKQPVAPVSPDDQEDALLDGILSGDNEKVRKNAFRRSNVSSAEMMSRLGDQVVGG